MTVNSNMLSEKWNKRFEFFEQYGFDLWAQYGVGKSSEFAQAYQKLSSMDKLKISFNFWAFFFGPIYYVILGMWKKAISLTAVTVACLVVIGLLINIDSAPVENYLSLIPGIIFGVMANISFFLHKKGSTSWNPFEIYKPNHKNQ